MNYKKIAIKAIRVGGKILKNNFFKLNMVKGKGEHDIVTQTDIDSEKAIIKVIKKYFPEHTIVAEESGSHSNNSDYVWYIDPLDGTSNFITGNPYFSISIALAYKNEIILGIVFNPVLNELYTAEKDGGAYLNDKKLIVSKNNNLSDSILASAYSADENDIKQGLKTIETLALNSRKTVINFSPALDLCNIARGKIDGLIDNGTTPEDHAAGSLILLEAGGKVQNYQSNEWDVNKKGIIASNGHLQNFIIDLVK